MGYQSSLCAIAQSGAKLFFLQTCLQESYVVLFCVKHIARVLLLDLMAPGVSPAALRAMPGKNVKLVSFIRHGEGYHNVAGAKHPSNYGSYEYEDAHLTDLGHKQVG